MDSRGVGDVMSDTWGNKVITTIQRMLVLVARPHVGLQCTSHLIVNIYYSLLNIKISAGISFITILLNKLKYYFRTVNG